MEEEEELKWEFECAQRLFGMPSMNSGTLVETRTGLVGRTYSHEEPINGKVRVYLTNGKIQFLDESWYSVEELKKLIDKVNGNTN